MSEHLQEGKQTHAQEVKIQQNQHPVKEIFQQNQTQIQNQQKEQDKHGEIDQKQYDQNHTLQQQQIELQKTKDQNEIKQPKEEQVQLALTQKVDTVQLPENAQKIQQHVTQTPQVAVQVEVKKQQTNQEVSCENKSQEQIQIQKRNEFKIQAQHQQTLLNETDVHQIEKQINKEIKQQEANTKEIVEQISPKAQLNQDSKQKKQQNEIQSNPEKPKNIEIEVQGTQKQQIRKSSDDIENKQSTQQNNITVYHQQKLENQGVKAPQKQIQPIQEKQKSQTNKPINVQETFSQKISKEQSQQNKQNDISQSKAQAENLENKLRKLQLTQKQSKQTKLYNESQLAKFIFQYIFQTQKISVLKMPQQIQEPIYPKAQSQRVVQSQIKQEKVEIINQTISNEYKQVQKAEQINIVSVPVQQVQTHEQGLKQITPYQVPQVEPKQNVEKQKCKIEIKQNKTQSKELQPQKVEEQQTTNKHKLRVYSQYIESVADQNKQKEKKVIEFTEFVPTQNNQTPNQRLQDVDNTQKIAVKTEISSEKKMIQHQQQQLKATFHPSYQQIEPIPLNKLKPTQIAQNIVESKQSPRKQYGKISKRTLYDKKVHEIVKQLNKYDQKKSPVPTLQAPKKSSKKMIDLSKLDTHIQLASNVMNLTIGELTGQDAQVQSSEKLLTEIQSLKKKLSELQRKKQERMKHQLQRESPEKGENSKFSKNQFTGRIIKKAEQGQSRLSEQVKPLTSGKKSETIAIQPATISSASRNRITSTLGFQTQKQIDRQPETDMSKTMAINFRVRRPSKNSQNLSQFQFNQKESGKKNRQRLDSDKCFQTSRRQQVFQKLQFTQEQSLTTIEKPVERQLKHEPYFRDYVEKYFIDIGKQVPAKYMDQQQFVQLAKKTFKKFGVNLQAQRSAALSVKKYNNCISFILDTNRTIIWYYEGKFYFGGWVINSVGEGEKSGWGYEYVPGKYVYSGTFKQNKRDSYGIIKFLARQNDTIYQGGWSNGFKQGLGKQIEPDNVEYIGSWSQGKKHGYGTLRISQCEYYSGYFLQGIKNGQGTQVFKNGDRYIGNYKDGKFQGKGTYTWSNYSKYEGDFVEGIRNGYGFWIANYLDESSDRYEGQYKNDKKNGYGVYKWKDGTTYQGQFVNDLKHGEGTVSYGDGRRATLQWFQGSVVPRPTAEKSQRNSVKKGRAGSSQKSDSKSHRFEVKLNPDHKSKGKRLFN